MPRGRFRHNYRWRIAGVRRSRCALCYWLRHQEASRRVAQLETPRVATKATSLRLSRKHHLAREQVGVGRRPTLDAWRPANGRSRIWQAGNRSPRTRSEGQAGGLTDVRTVERRQCTLPRRALNSLASRLYLLCTASCPPFHEAVRHALGRVSSLNLGHLVLRARGGFFVTRQRARQAGLRR